MFPRVKPTDYIDVISPGISKLDAVLRSCKVRPVKIKLSDISSFNPCSVSGCILVECSSEGEITKKDILNIKKLKSKGFIIYLSKINEASEVLAIKFGALDVVHAGMSVSVISERISAAMRRRAECANREFISLTLNAAKHYIEINSQRQKLTLSEVRIIEALALNPGGIVSRSRLLSILETSGGTLSHRSVDSHIKRLRLKILGICPDGKIIEAVYGAGYRLSMMVVVVWEPLNAQSRDLLRSP